MSAKYRAFAKANTPRESIAEAMKRDAELCVCGCTRGRHIGDGHCLWCGKCDEFRPQLVPDPPRAA